MNAGLLVYNWSMHGMVLTNSRTDLFQRMDCTRTYRNSYWFVWGPGGDWHSVLLFVGNEETAFVYFQVFCWALPGYNVCHLYLQHSCPISCLYRSWVSVRTMVDCVFSWCNCYNDDLCKWMGKNSNTASSSSFGRSLKDKIPGCC